MNSHNSKNETVNFQYPSQTKKLTPLMLGATIITSLLAGGYLIGYLFGWLSK